MAISSYWHKLHLSNRVKLLKKEKNIFSWFKMLIGRENQTRVRPETTKHIYSSVSYFYIALIHRKSKLGGGGHRLIQYWLNVDWLIDRLARLRLNRTDRVSSILRRRLHFTVDIAKNRLLSKNQERERDRDNFLPFFFFILSFPPCRRWPSVCRDPVKLWVNNSFRLLSHRVKSDGWQASVDISLGNKRK